jgi:hypothetical protein
METSRVALPNRTQGAALDFMGGGVWRMWLHTPDHVHGTYLVLRSDGSITRVTVRQDEGDDEVLIKPAE